SQVEVAVRETYLLTDLDVVVDRERQRSGGAEDLDIVGDDLDLAGRDAGVLVAVGTFLDGADDLEAVLRPQLVGDLLADDHLDDPGRFTQVDERDAAVISSSGHPAG